MDLIDAAYNVVHDYPGGASSLAPRLGKGSSSLSHELTCTGFAKLGLKDAAKITQLTGDRRILAAWALQEGQMLVPLPMDASKNGDQCLLRLGDSAREFGEFCAEVGGALADGSITDNELSRIDRECGELIASVHALREALAQRNADGKKGRL